MNTPRTVSERERYRLLGMLTDDQRIIMCYIMAESAMGRWANLETKKLPTGCWRKRIAEIMEHPEMPVEERKIPDINDNGRRITAREFAII